MHPVLFSIGSLLCYGLLLPILFFLVHTPYVWKKNELLIEALVVFCVSLIGFLITLRKTPRKWYLKKLLILHGTFAGISFFVFIFLALH